MPFGMHPIPATATLVGEGSLARVLVTFLARFHAPLFLSPGHRPLKAEIAGSGAHRITGTRSLRRAKQNTNPMRRLDFGSYCVMRPRAFASSSILATSWTASKAKFLGTWGLHSTILLARVN